MFPNNNSNNLYDIGLFLFYSCETWTHIPLENIDSELI